MVSFRVLLGCFPGGWGFRGCGVVLGVWFGLGLGGWFWWI